MIIHTKYWCPKCEHWISAGNKKNHQARHRGNANAAKKAQKRQMAGVTVKKFERGKLKNQARTKLQNITQCAYCKLEGDIERGPDGLFWNMDHIVPWSIGQIESLENYVKSCHTCNLAKRDSLKFPTTDTMTASGSTFRTTSLFYELLKSGQDPRNAWRGVTY
jgi:hypothetical protein